MHAVNLLLVKRTRAAAPLLLLVASGLIAGCAGNDSATFPPGLEPLDENRAPWPVKAGDDPYPEDIAITTGEADDFDWAHARAYVKAPLAKTWEAMRTPDACVDRTEVTRWTIEEDVEPEYAYSYRIHNVVESVATIEFENTWRHGVVEGTLDAPEQIAARYQKTWGSTYITMLQGSFVAKEIDDGVTQIEMIEQIDAFAQDSETASNTLRNYFKSIVALAHDKPLP